jgi:CRISPR-associated endonuclease Cas2
MPRKKFKSFFEEILHLKLGSSGLSGKPFATIEEIAILPVSERVQRIIKLNQKARSMKPGEIYFFVFYDIQNNKVRQRIAKYLIKNGCERIQKSVYLALLSKNQYNQMKATLAMIQKLYDNDDSIIFLPVGTEQIESMKLIGHNLDFSLYFEQKNTLFF